MDYRTARSIRVGSFSWWAWAAISSVDPATANRRAPSSTPRWMWASHCSTRPTATGRGGPLGEVSGRRPQKAAVTTRSLPPSSPRRWAMVPCNAAARVGTSCRPLRTASAGCERTTSTSIRCTGRTPIRPSRRRFPRSISLSARARCDTSGIRTLPAGRSPPPLPPPSAPTSPRSYQRRTNTASSTEAWNLKSSRHARPLACRCSHISRSPADCSAGNTGRAWLNAGRYARLAEGSQADRWRTPTNVAPNGAAALRGGRARPHLA